ncbi:MAG: hypothetical protein K2X74_05975 [Acetobacteraceae bacterium]|nr:hypothetical protein [Acetobacteraceae bacterium]
MRESASRLRHVAKAVRSRRGTVATAFAVSATALLGMVALAAEGGVWQLQQRNARTAADLAALAGATAIENGTNAVNIATDAATRNGFTNNGDGGRTLVNVNRPPLSGTYAGNASAIEVVVRQTQNLGMARLALGTAPLVQSRAVALNSLDVNACLLALGGGLALGGNSTMNAQRCALAANSTQYGINIFGSATVRASDLVTTGSCTGCSSGNVWTDNTMTQRPSVVANRQSPVADPYRNLQNWTPTPPACATTVRTNSFANQNAADGALCNVTLGPNDTLNLNSGLYYVKGNLDIRGTLRSVGSGGVTLVLTGDNTSDIGRITINAQSRVDITGPTTSLIPGYAEGKGVVIYRDARATNNGPQNEVKLNGGSDMRIVGAVYLPTSDVQVNGNNGTNYSTCMPVVGYALSFSGTSDTRIDVSGCNNFAAVPQLRTPRLVE